MPPPGAVSKPRLGGLTTILAFVPLVRRLSEPTSSLPSALRSPPIPLRSLPLLFPSSPSSTLLSATSGPSALKPLPSSLHDSPLTLLPVSNRLSPLWCAPKCPSFSPLSRFPKKIFARFLLARNSLRGLDFHHCLLPVALWLVPTYHRLGAHQSVRPPPVWRTCLQEDGRREGLGQVDGQPSPGWRPTGRIQAANAPPRSAG